MPAGKLRERVAFDQREAQSDGYGNSQADWAEEFVEQARVRPRLGGEAIVAARLAGRQPFTITLRYSLDTARITPEWRARNVRTGEIYNIRSVSNPDERKRFIELLVESGVTV